MAKTTKTEEQKAAEAAALAEEQKTNEASQPAGVDPAEDNGAPRVPENEIVPDKGSECLAGALVSEKSADTTEMRDAEKLGCVLEDKALSILNNIPDTGGEYNDAQLKQISAALEIYIHLKGHY